MSRKGIIPCSLCGRPVARDAAVKLAVVARRGPELVEWVRAAPPLQVCPWCARTRSFRVCAEPPSPEPPAAPPSTEEVFPLGPQ